MAMTAQELLTVFNEVADTPAELKALLTRSGVKGELEDRLRRFKQRAADRIANLQGQIDTLVSAYRVAIEEAEAGDDPTTIPTSADEDNALA